MKICDTIDEMRAASRAQPARRQTSGPGAHHGSAPRRPSVAGARGQGPVRSGSGVDLCKSASVRPGRRPGQISPRLLIAIANCSSRRAWIFIFAPSVEEMYPAGAVTYVTVEGLSDKLCGRSRPGHFRGVTTVVSKLFNIVEPDLAFFGQKDAAQSTIIRRMVRDLNIPVQVVICPIVREAGRPGHELAQRLSGSAAATSPRWCCIARSWRCRERFDQGERKAPTR